MDKRENNIRLLIVLSWMVSFLLMYNIYGSEGIIWCNIIFFIFIILRINFRKDSVYKRYRKIKKARKNNLKNK